MTVKGTSTLTSIPPLLERAKLAFVVALRSAFASQVTNEHLRYSEIQADSKIRIYTAHPLTIEFFPSIVISAGSGDISIKYLADDFVEEVVGQNAEVIFAGRMAFTISITIYAGSTLERERILDHLIIFVRHLFRHVLHGFGLEYTRDMRVGPEILREVENKPVYEQTMDIPVYMEYRASIDQSAFDTIQNIDLTINPTLNVK